MNEKKPDLLSGFFFVILKKLLTMKKITYLAILLAFAVSCNKKENEKDVENKHQPIAIGGDFSIMKKMEDSGGVYKLNEVEKEGLQIFKDNGFTWARLRIFHTPNMEGPVCNDLDYTIKLAKKANEYGFKIFLNFHYSDTWADPGKQYVPKAWENLPFETLTDSVYVYTLKVLRAMNTQGVLPEMVQIGNEINNGMIWPHGKLWNETGNANWVNLANILKAGISAVRAVEEGKKILVMVHAATGGNLEESGNFFKNIIRQGVEFDIIGLSYYPWWHGTFDQLDANIEFLSSNFIHEISLVETAYYANNWYPEPSGWVLNVQPFPPTEQGQFDFMVELLNRLQKHKKVTSLFYWKPDGLDIPASNVPFLGRSLFDHNGNALKGINAWNK